MAQFVFAMNLSLDGYVDHDKFAPDPVLFQHWTEQVRDRIGENAIRLTYIPAQALRTRLAPPHFHELRCNSGMLG